MPDDDFNLARDNNPNAIIKVTLVEEIAGLFKRLEEMLDPKELLLGIFHLFDRLAQKAAGHIIKTQLSGQALKRRTGSLAKSIVGRAVMYGGLPAIRVGIFRGPALAYAGVQEFGTKGANALSPYDTIRPVNAKALAVPLEPVLTPAGVPRIQGPRQYEERFGAPLRFIPFRRGIAVGALYDERLLEQERDRAKASKTPMNFRNLQAAYLLLREVDIPPSAYLFNGLLSYLPEIVLELRDYLRDVFGNLRSQAQ